MLFSLGIPAIHLLAATLFAGMAGSMLFDLGMLAMHILEVMFFVGMAGSAIVVLISFVEDTHELLGKD